MRIVNLNNFRVVVKPKKDSNVYYLEEKVDGRYEPKYAVFHDYHLDTNSADILLAKLIKEIGDRYA